MVRSFVLAILSVCIIALSINAQPARRSVKSSTTKIASHQSISAKLKQHKNSLIVEQEAQYSAATSDLNPANILIFDKEEEERTEDENAINAFKDGLVINNFLQVNTQKYSLKGNNHTLSFYRNVAHATYNLQTQFQVFQI